MKRFYLLAFLVLTVSVSAFAQKGAAGRVDPAKGVHEAFDRLVEGITQVDVDKVMGVYEKSPRLLIFNNNGSATQGWENVRSNLAQSYPHITNVTLDVTGLRIEMLGKTAAFVTCKWKQSQENNGKLENASGRMTLVFKLVGKEWKIAHRHTSPDLPGPNAPLFPSERESQ
jgi:ketosteroid isomerase-like protein